MKKIGIAIVAIIVAVMLGGNFYYTHKASKECRIVLTMAHNMENNGTIDSERAAYYYRAIARSRNVMYPVRSLDRLQRIHINLQCELDEYNNQAMSNNDGTYCALTK